MAEAFFTYGKISHSIRISGISPSIVATKFKANLAEMFLRDSKYNVIMIDNEKFDSPLKANESYKVYDDREIQLVETSVVAPITKNYVSSFKNSLQVLAPADNINSNIKLQALAMVTVKAKDISLDEGDHKYIQNTQSLRAAIHDLTSAATKAYLETSNCAGEIHAGLNNVLKGVPDMLKEVDNPNSDSAEILRDLESWMTDTLTECFEEAEKGSQQTQQLWEHIQELQKSFISSLQSHDTKTDEDDDENKEKLTLLKTQQKRYEEAMQAAKLEIDKAWETKRLDENAEDEYDAARESYIKKSREISGLQFKIEQANKNGAKHEEVLTMLRDCILEIQGISENWRKASASISDMKIILQVENEGKRWENALSKNDLNKDQLIENMLKFMSVGYKVDYWANIQNQLIKKHFLPLASSANNVFGGGNVVSLKNEGEGMISQATALVKEEQSKIVKEFESDIKDCLSLPSVAAVVQTASNRFR